MARILPNTPAHKEPEGLGTTLEQNLEEKSVGQLDRTGYCS